jgi:stress-induced-phosphoprotein 1
LALGHYTDALVLLASATDAELWAEDVEAAEAAAALYSNRSAAHASLGQGRLALQDAESATELRPEWARGWSRKGAALFLQQDWAGAVGAYARGLQLEPENAALHKGLADAKIAALSQAGEY